MIWSAGSRRSTQKQIEMISLQEQFKELSNRKDLQVWSPEDRQGIAVRQQANKQQNSKQMMQQQGSGE